MSDDPQPAVPVAQAAAEILEMLLAAGRVDTTMFLTDGEVARALEIKRAVEDVGEEEEWVLPLNDFEYVQYAIVCEPEEPMKAILHKMAMVQAFKREYQIMDTVEQGVQMLDQGTSDLLPGFLVAIEYLASSSSYLSVENWSKFYVSAIQTDEQLRILINLNYYNFKVKEPHFQAVRNGSSVFVECTGANMQDNFDMKLMETILHSFWIWYPRKLKETFYVNAPSVVSFWFGLIKKYLPSNQIKTVNFGSFPGLEGERIDLLYQMPSEEAARQKMLINAKKLLETRYHNERTFVLNPPPE